MGNLGPCCTASFRLKGTQPNGPVTQRLCSMNQGMRLSLAAWNPVRVQLDLRSFRPLLRVNILKRSGRKIFAVGMKIKAIGRDAVQRVVLFS